MIHIEQPGMVKIMRHQPGNSSSLSLVLVKNINNEEIQVETEIDTNHEFYYIATIPSVPEGEYTYQLVDDNGVLDSGLLYYGDPAKINKIEHKIENKVYTYERKKN